LGAAVKSHLVLQFTARTLADFNQLVALEEKLTEHLNGLAIVDGHDFGQSEFNIFILSDNPVAIFGCVQHIIPSMKNMRAGARTTSSFGHQL
jgi:hypothetical protein